MQKKTAIYVYATSAFIFIDMSILLVLSLTSMGCSNEGYQLCQVCSDPNNKFSHGQKYQETFFSPVAVVTGGVFLSILNLLIIWGCDMEHKISGAMSENYNQTQAAMMFVGPASQIIYLIIILALSGANESIKLWTSFPITLSLTLVWCGFVFIRSLFQFVWTSFFVPEKKAEKK